MSENILFELADCIGEALAKRWLNRRARGPAPRRMPADQSTVLIEAPGGAPATAGEGESYQQPSAQEKRT